MEIVRCEQGHFYDSERYATCPQCAKEQMPDIGRWFHSAILRDFSQPEPLASGSSCKVYRVQKEGKNYALKVIDCGYDREKFNRAQNEIILMQRLKHCKNVVQLIDSDVLRDWDGTVVLLLEPFMTSFEEYYKTHNMTTRDALRLGIDICTALQDCWSAGVAHLDVQPKNLFVDDYGRFCLGDFGSSVPVMQLKEEQQLHGTLSYMAPEVYENREYSQASEIYSLGMVLYCLLNHGNLPFMETGSKREAVMTRLAKKVPVPSLNLSKPLDHLLLRALAVNFQQRYETFADLRLALAEADLSETNADFSDDAVMCNDKEDFGKADSAAGYHGDIRTWKCPKCAMTNSGKFCCNCGSPNQPAEAKSSKRTPFAWPQNFKRNKKQPETAVTPPRPAPVSSTENVGGTMFDSDTFATTCAPGAMDFSSMAPTEPIEFFGVPDYASRTYPVGKIEGTLFDSDSYATTCAPGAMEFSPIGCSEPVGCTSFDPSPSMAPPTPCSPYPGYSEMQGYRTGYTPAPRMSQVQFSAIAPKEARKEDYSIIQLFMYEQAFRAVVEEAIAMADAPVQEKRSGFQNVRENTRVKVVLTCPDMPIEDNIQEQIWCGGYLQFDFAICPPETLKKRQILLTASVYFDDVPATRLMLTVKALASYEEEIELARQDIVTAFVSYASQDRNRVGALIQGMQKARPDMDIFFDVTTLRSGENWENTLYREILGRDILFLCWSRNAMASAWVEREWRYALENKGLEAIEPIPLEQPDICPPPKELWSKHFNDSLLYIIGGTTPADDVGRTMPVSPTFPAVPATAQPANIFPVDPVNDNKDKILNPVVGWLVCIQGASRGTDFRIHNQYNYIGRAKHMHICIPTDPLICAEKAAVLAYDNTEKTFLFSPGSGNTLVRVNGSLVLSAVVLKAYDVLTIGNTQLLFIPLCGDHFDWNNQ